MSLGVKTGDVVCLKVDLRDRVSTDTRGVIGIIVKLAATNSCNAAIVTKHGLIISSGNKPTMFDPANYTILRTPTITSEMQKIKDGVENGEITVDSLTNDKNFISIRKAHELDNNSNPSVKKDCGNCRCKGLQCGGRCGCMRNNNLCSSSCGCGPECSNHGKS